MIEFVLSPAARQDLHDIWDYIAKDSRRAADRLIARIQQTIEKIVAVPELGHPHQDLADETLQVWPVRSYLIVYRPKTKPLQIVRIISGYRDILSLFNS